ncbi:MAG: aminoacyl-tRNA hydrolase [Bacteroidota bacterium]|nr:aminoacyl-tRNA hydrolase [Bacteroidota bacterium]MDP4213845.1 aminoacyl-tRNA hydrolase [Bacteroidota bacterium]MDP4250095.1 aminoacyl-tRNA hydrolase [Bacteroidota bacterium]
MSSFLIAGLGNIGAEYEGTRHNIGFDVVAALVAKHEGSFSVDRLAALSEIKFRGRTLTCILPSTYMNLSGKAVKYWLDRKKIPLERLLVIADDLALPLSRLRLRPSGSDAGHNGLKSLFAELQTEQYARLRYGIGNDFPRGMQVEYVLGRWRPEELPLVKAKNEKAVQMIESFVTAGLQRTMNDYNKMEITL